MRVINTADIMEAAKQELKVNDTVAGSQLAQVSVVNANGGLVTMDFVYIHPRQAAEATDKLEGQVVSRVTMPFADAKNFATALANVLVEHGKKFTEQ